jgi:hypothetical protein
MADPNLPALLGIPNLTPVQPPVNAPAVAGMPNVVAPNMNLNGAGANPNGAEAAHNGGVNGGPQPIAVAAAMPAWPPQVFPQVLRHTTFASLYHDENKDPLRSRAASVITRFDAMAAAPQTPEALLEASVGNPSIPGTFMCCAALQGNTKHRIYVLHGLSKYVPAMDGRETPWDNRIFGFLGELLGDQAVSIAIPSTAFNVVQCYVYNDARFAVE